MDFKCNFCVFLSNEINEMFSHLRKEHKVVENSDRIECIVNFEKPNSCQRSYLTFSGLRTHTKSCLKSKREENQLVRVNLA